MEGEGKGGRERKKGMRESKYRETEIQTDGEEQKRDRDRETKSKRGRVTCGDNEETKNRVSSLDICGCLPSMYLCMYLSGVRHNNNLLSICCLSSVCFLSIYICLFNYLPAYLTLIIYHLSHSDIERYRHTGTETDKSRQRNSQIERNHRKTGRQRETREGR